MKNIIIIMLLVVTMIFAADGDKKWEFQTNGWVASSPVMGDDGTIYIVSDDHTLYAVNPDGTKKWEFRGDSLLGFSAIVSEDGTIYVCSGNGVLFALNSEGIEKWQFDAGDWINSTPVIGKNEVVYLGANDSVLYAINADGTKKWQSQIGSYAQAIGADGTIYVLSDSAKLYALNINDGTELWNVTMGVPYLYNNYLAIASDGTIYVAGDTKLYAIDKTGSKKWEFDTIGDVTTAASIGSDGTVYVGNLDNRLFAINPDGTKKWEFLAESSIYSAPAVGSDGIIYVGSLDSKLYAINPDGTRKWEFATGNDIVSSAAISNDGTLYIGSNDGKLYAIETNSLGLANSSWPRYGHDNKNTGNISLEGRNATARQKIEGLYIAFFNRAPDYDGLTWWDNRAKRVQATGGSSLDVLKELARGFAKHPVFISTYSGMTNQQFVEAIYRNVLGKEGDSEGIAYWTNILNKEEENKFPDMVASFVDISLSLSITSQNFPTLTKNDIEAAQERQNLIINKVNVATAFVDKLGTLTNVTDSENPQNDSSYIASIKILKEVTSDFKTGTSAIDYLDSIKNGANPIDKLIQSWGNYERLKKTGEISSSYDGDDGFYQRGEEISYANNSNGTITDNVTKLIWQNSSENNSTSYVLNWSDAVSYCTDLELGGYDDWRLPSVDELMTLSDKGRYKPSINPMFDYVANSTYWSSDSYENNTSYAWIVGFEYGQTTQWSPKTNRNYLRCVRGEKSTKTYTRDDYNSIVTDTKHGLMWQDDNATKISPKTWKDAIDYCEDLTLDGYNDWHLPNFNEIFSIVDLNKSNTSVDSTFINTANGRYWSSTSIAEGYSDAWIVNFIGGDAYYMDWYDKYYVRCVRYKE